MKQIFFLFSLLLIILACGTQDQEQKHQSKDAESQASLEGPYVQVLGVAQDAGYPQLGCTKSCCKDLWDSKEARKMVSCIGVVNPDNSDYWIFDATPDVKDQVSLANKSLDQPAIKLPAGVFLTHAHMGHYTGLMQFGKEAFGSKDLPVYTMPKMHEFLSSNGPWDQLVSLNNIALKSLTNNEPVFLNENLEVIPFRVPHRDEYSETVGYKIVGPNKKVIFIPDIDKWEKWDRDIIEEIQQVDIALLDGSFFRNGEIFGRDMSLIPHPFIKESMKLFNNLPADEKSKIYFIHFNHTNPVLKADSEAYKEVISMGYNIAIEGQKIMI